MCTCCNDSVDRLLETARIKKQAHTLYFITAGIAGSAGLAAAVFSSVTRAILRFFSPQGRHTAPMGVEFGMKVLIKGRLFHAKFHPHQCRLGCTAEKTDLFWKF